MKRAVKTVKSILEKAKDPYVSLLSYRSTPLANGYSPAELLANEPQTTLYNSYDYRTLYSKDTTSFGITTERATLLRSAEEKI